MGGGGGDFSDILKYVKWKPTAWNPTRNFKKRKKMCFCISESKQTFTQDQTKREVEQEIIENCKIQHIAKPRSSLRIMNG